MEEKNKLETKLTHTSKEPEAQVWAQIGTKSYDPPLPANDVDAKNSKEESPAKKPPSQENGKSRESSEAMESTDNQEESFFIDTGTESEKPEEKTEEKTEETPEEAQKPKEQPKSKSFTLGDGFVEPSAAETEDDTSKSRKKSEKRSRSRSHERKRSPGREKYTDYSTNSSNPDDVKSRVFIGHLNTDKCEKKEVDELFRPYGKILGVNLQNGYGFVQYEEEKSVKEAIKNLHNTEFHGDKLVVDRPVAMKKLEAGRSRRHSSRSSRELMEEELEYYRRRERRRYEEMYGRPSRRDWDPRSRPPMPPLLPPQPPPGYYGDYFDRGDRYGVGDMGYGRYGEEPRYRGGDRYRDDQYRGDDRYSRDEPYRSDAGRNPYDYSVNQRGNPYGDQYGKPVPRRM